MCHAVAGKVGEEVEVGVARDFRMLREELRELGIGVGDVVLIGEERGVGLDDLREGGAHAEEGDELLADGDEFVVGGRGS